MHDFSRIDGPRLKPHQQESLCFGLALAANLYISNRSYMDVLDVITFSIIQATSATSQILEPDYAHLHTTLAIVNR